MTDETRHTLAFAIEALRREAATKREAHDNMAAIRYLHEAKRIAWIMEGPSETADGATSSGLVVWRGLKYC